MGAGAATKDSLKTRYREILIGFERYSFTEEQIYETRHDFELALHDLAACKACDGEICKTVINHRCSNLYWHQHNPCTKDCYPLQLRGYYTLWHKACRQEGRPMFAVHICPGPAERKEQLLGKKTRTWWDD